MTPEEAINLVSSGHMIDCTRDEYLGSIRDALQVQAAKWIDQRQDAYSQLALKEVERLDQLYPVDTPEVPT